MPGASGPTSVKAPAATPAGTNLATATSAPGTEPVKPFAGGYSWQQIAGAIDADPRMRPGVASASRADVFPTAPPADVASALETEPVPEEPLARLSPSEAGLVLSSTIVGRTRQTALINGRRYAVGDEIKSTKEGQQIVFKLLAVEPRQIVLENAGDRFLVKMPGARLSNDDSLE